MPFIRAQVRWTNDTGAAADDVVNTFHFATSGTGSIEDESGDIVGLLATWAAAVDGLLSENLVTPVNFTTYNLEDLPPRAPIESTDNAATFGAGSQPNQIAAVVRYRANYVSGVPRARLRGRHYIGPLSGLGVDGTGDMDVSSTLVTALAGAYGPLFPPSVGVASGSTLSWSVFSRAIYDDTVGSVPAKLAAAFDTVTVVGVPNRYGTQRRRSTAVTSVTNIP